jgi:plastocyanin
MKFLPVAVAVAFTSGCVVAFAAERSISQKGRVFSEREISIKKGDAIRFVNDDDVFHNVLSVSPGNEFNLGSQGPGVSTPVTFTTAGTIDVVCAIHPRMKIAIKVTD